MAKAKVNSSEFQKFVATAGFDPLRDIDELVLVAPAGKQKSRGLALIRGSFDPTRLAELAVQPGVTATAFHGVQVFTKTENQPASLACLDQSLVLAGDPESVRTAILRRGKAPAIDPALVGKAAELSMLRDVWLVSRMPPVEMAAGSPAEQFAAGPQMQMLKTVEMASGGLRFGPNLLMDAEVTTRTPKDADAIAAIVRMFAGLAASNKRDAKQAGAILERLSIKTEANVVKLSMWIPQEELSRAFDSSLAGLKARLGQTQPAASAGTAARPAAGAATTARPAPQANPGTITIYSSGKDMGVVTLPAPKQ